MQPTAEPTISLLSAGQGTKSGKEHASGRSSAQWFTCSDFTRRAYGTNYIETLRVQLHANCRIRRIYFSDRLYSEEELPPEYYTLFIALVANSVTNLPHKPQPRVHPQLSRKLNGIGKLN